MKTPPANRRGSNFPPFLLIGVFTDFLSPHLEQVHHDQHEDGHIDERLGNMVTHTLGDQIEADHHQDDQAKNLKILMLVDELGDLFSRHDHHGHGNQNSGDHDGDFLDHADGGDHRVQGKDDIHQADLKDHTPKSRNFFVDGLFFERIHLVQNFLAGLDDQEDAATHQNQVLPGKIIVQIDLHERIQIIVNRHHHIRQLHHPADAQQQQNASDQRERHTQTASQPLLRFRQNLRNDVHEHQIVDAQNDFQSGQHGQGQQSIQGKKSIQRFHFTLNTKVENLLTI